MKHFAIVVGLIILVLLSACGSNEGTITASKSSDKEPKINQEKVNRIMENGIGHHIGVYKNLPEHIKTYLKKNPKMLKELVVGPDPTFMGVMDSAKHYLGEVDGKDVKYLYEHEDFYWTHREPYGNGEEPPAYKRVPNKDIINMLKNN